jgi:CheY-like chemotaxis protein
MAEYYEISKDYANIVRVRLIDKDFMNDWKDRSILIAEDDVINFNLLNIMLRSTGINVIWAKNGLEAVTLFEENPGINVILMDIQMPVMDGNVASVKIREINQSVPIIVISAYTSFDIRQKAKEAGTNEFINKPVQSSHLLDVVAKYL